MLENGQVVHGRMQRLLQHGRRRFIRYSLLVVNIIFLGVVVSIVLQSKEKQNQTTTASFNLISQQEVSDPIDTLTSADIAWSVVNMSAMAEAESIAHNLDAEGVKKSIVPSGAQAIAKPQIIETQLKSKYDIRDYIVAEGDTLESISVRFGVSSRSISWSNNNVQPAEIRVGDTLVIPPVDGLVYSVEPGDTPAGLASRFRSDVTRITAMNDAEIDGLIVGDQIIIPDGQIVPVLRGASLYNFTAAYGGNGYVPGNCTWHAANRRAAVGKPLPSNLGNAATWVARAAAAGIATGSIPQKYAAVQTATSGWGHVGFVEDVYEDGSMLMSEMNYNWSLYALRTRVVSAEEAARYRYVY